MLSTRKGEVRVCERVVRVAWVEGGRADGFWRGGREMRRWVADIKEASARERSVGSCILKGWLSWSSGWGVMVGCAGA